MIKKAIINVHGNPTLSRIVQELAFKAWRRWGGASGCSVNHLDSTFIYMEPNMTMFHSKKGDLENWPTIDAATQFDKVIAFFEQPAKPVIKLGDYIVEWTDTGIKVGCTAVTKEQVAAIYKELHKEAA